MQRTSCRLYVTFFVRNAQAQHVAMPTAMLALIHAAMQTAMRAVIHAMMGAVMRAATCKAMHAVMHAAVHVAMLVVHKAVTLAHESWHVQVLSQVLCL